MPFQKERYPADWKHISLRVRERDGQRCKFCGVSNKAVGARDRYGVWHDSDAIQMMNSGQGMDLFGEEYPKIIQIVLTVAHLDHDTTNNSDDNLAALCQKCHLNYDHEHHIANAKTTRARKKRAKIAADGQLELL